MQKGILKSELLLLLAAAIWGFAFVAQRVGMEDVGPFIFNGVRFALGSLALLPFILLSRKRTSADPDTRVRSKGLSVYIAGFAAGTVLFLAASLQQAGIVYTTAGKAGFITGLYVILVPILGLVVHQKTPRTTWAGAVIAAAGLYLLSFTGGFSIMRGDILVLLSTFFWAVHVLMIGRFTRSIDSLLLACIQFAVCSMFSLVVAFTVERIDIGSLISASVPILYGGLISVGIAYTLQIIAQKKAPPGHSAIILSFETVFAVLGGRLLLSETIPPRGMVGCALMLAGILLSQRGRRA